MYSDTEKRDNVCKRERERERENMIELLVGKRNNGKLYWKPRIRTIIIYRPIQRGMIIQKRILPKFIRCSIY